MLLNRLMDCFWKNLMALVSLVQSSSRGRAALFFLMALAMAVSVVDC